MIYRKERLDKTKIAKTVEFFASMPQQGWQKTFAWVFDGESGCAFSAVLLPAGDGEEDEA